MSYGTLLFLGGLSLPELAIIFLIILILFGAKKIPQIARGMGNGIREFKDSLQGEEKSKNKK